MRYGDLQGPFNKKKTPYLEVRRCEILKGISEKRCMRMWNWNLKWIMIGSTDGMLWTKS